MPAEHFSHIHNLLISLALSLLLRSFSGTGKHSIIFRLFLVRGFPPSVLGRQGILFPQKKPIRQSFPLHTRFKSETSYQENAYFSLSLSLVRSVVYPFLVFSGRYIYSHILLLLSLFGDPRERVRVEKSSHRGDEIRFFRYSFLCAFLFFRETLLQLETLDTI